MLLSDKTWRRVAGAVVGLAALGASAQTATSLDAKVQAPKLGVPERGSLVGQFANTAFGPGDVSRGGFQLPSALGLPSERGGPLAGVLPGYSPESGLTEWGLGWQTSLALTRWRVVGDLDYATDELTGPWGRMVRGQDGDWYPLGLSSNVRLREQSNGWVAYLPDGTRWTFGLESRVDTAKGTYAWYLDEVQTVLGRKMKLEYEQNTSGRRFLKAVHYGGTGEDFQYRADFVYETVAETVRDLRSGQALVLDRRVKNVIAWVRNAQTGVFEERWRETLTYEDDTLGPAFYLTGVQRTYASGEKAPAVTYRYYKPEEQLAQTALRRNSRLDGVLTQFGVDATQPNKAALLDINLDGRPDLEHHYDNTLLVQGDTGFTAEPLPAAATSVSALCRPAPSTLNQPRTLAQMRASEDAHQVVALRANTYRTETTFEVCDRAGFSMATQTLSGDWTLGANVRLVDINRDRQPDLVKVSSGRATILPNTSSGAGFSFGAAKVATLSSVAPFTPNTSWVHDLNGDGVADIIARGGSGSLTVWMGKGDFSFEAAKSFQFLGSTGVPLSSLTDYQVTFLDANKDGLSDVLLTRATGSGSYLYTNTGTGFTQKQVPALQAMTGTLSRPVVGDFAGTGDTEVAYVISNQAHSLALDAPQTALMRSADDGKGTVLSFEYARSAAEPGVHGRSVLLSAMTAVSSGNDTVRYTYDYAQPTLHSVARFLVGYGSVTRTAPGSVLAASFLHADGFSGLPLSSTQHDTLSPGVHSYEYRTYEDALFQGIPWKRLKEEGGGWTQEDGQAVGERMEYLAYENEVCPSRTVRHTAHGTLIQERWRASVAALSLHLHCLEAGTRLTGTHEDDSLDFENEVRLTRNAQGLVEKVEDLAGSDSLTLQDVVYRPDFLVDTLSAPGRGVTRFEWQPGTLQLVRMTSPDGTVVEGSLHPLTDNPLSLTTWRGSQSVVQSFRFDGLERLTKQWTNVGGASELLPNLQLSYRYATATQPGSYTSSKLLDAAQGVFLSSMEWQTATGERVAKAARIPEGWRVDGLSSRNRNQHQSRTLVRPTLGNEVDVSTIDYATLLAGADVVNTLTTSGLGFDSQILTRLHADVTRQVATGLVVDNGLLRQETVENGTHRARRFLDAQRHVVVYEDEINARYEYGYDALGRLRRVTLPDGQRHRIFLDAHGRLARVEREGVATVVYGYDAPSGLLSEKSFLSPSGVPVRKESYFFDAIGRKILDVHLDVASGQTQSYRYHYDGATPTEPTRADRPGLLTAVEGEGFVKLFEYSPDGLLTRGLLQLTGWRTVERRFVHREDSSAREEEVVVRAADGSLLSRTHLANSLDGYGRAQSMTLNGELLASFAYNARGQMAAASLASGGWVAFSYDSLTQTPVGFSHAIGQVSSATAWRYNPRGLLDLETLRVGALNLQRAYGYSAQRFLTSSGDTQDAYGYAFDAQGLPTSIEENGQARALTRHGNTLQAGSTLYTFDNLGRTVSKDDLTFSYGPNGHLARASRGTETWEFLYDEAGQRLLKRKAGVPVAAYLEGGSYLDAYGLTQPFKLGGRLVGVLQDGAFFPLATDMRGSVLSDFDGTPRLASPFGSRAVAPASSAALDYVNKGRDPDLGLIRMGVRDYDSFINRFTTPDPLFLEQPEQCVSSPVECNLYGYARNLPVTLTDPTGTIAYDRENNEWRLQKGDTLQSAAEQVGFGALELYTHGNNRYISWGEVKGGEVVDIPREPRIRVFEAAAQQIGTSDYAFDVRLNDDFPEKVNKCNKFVADMVEKAGVPFPPHVSWLRGIVDRPAVSGTLGDPDAKLPRLNVVPSSEAKIGDVAAYKKFYIRASGHSVIYAGTVEIVKGRVGERLGKDEEATFRAAPNMRGYISPGSSQVLLRSEAFMESEGYSNPVFRRVER